MRTNTKQTVFSLEIFPPKPDADKSVIYSTLDGLADIEPDFISVTYGAGGGGNGSETLKIVSDIKHNYGFDSMAHLPCIGLTKAQAADILDRLEENSIDKEGYTIFPSFRKKGSL
ncbi:MAG: methylenetetrahydrofolate reductase [Treponema sp.]|nr:methylenetetrahydrofolate reductase [Treponema sp.]